MGRKSEVRQNRVRCVSGSAGTIDCAIPRLQIFHCMTCICGRSERLWPRGGPRQFLQHPMNRCSIRSFKGSLFASSVVSQSSDRQLSLPLIFRGMFLISALIGLSPSATPFSMNFLAGPSLLEPKGGHCGIAIPYCPILPCIRSDIVF